MARTFVFPRPRPRGLLGRKLDSGEQIVLGAGLILALIMLWLMPGIPLKIIGMVAPAGLCTWATLAPWKGRTYLRWWEINRSHKRLLKDGSLLYRSKAAYAGRYASGRRPAISVPVGVPQGLEWINARTAFGDIAILLQPEDRLFTASMEVEGQKHFGGLDSADKEALVRAYEFLLKSVADSGGRIRRLQWSVRIIPTDPNAHARDSAARRDPAAPAWLRESYDELQQALAISAEDRRLVLTVGIPYTKDLVAEATRYDTLHEGYAVVLGKEIEGFIRNLGRANLRYVTGFHEALLASYIHSQYDPSHWIDDTVGMDRVTAWPAEVDARNQTMMMSRTWEGSEPWFSATGWFQELPTLPVGVNFMAPLLLWLQDIICTISVTMDLIPSDRALQEAMADLTTELGQADVKAGQIIDPRETRAQAVASTSMHEIAQGAAGVRMVGWVTVTSRSKEALAQDKDEVRAQGTRALTRIQWTDGEHYRAFSNTLPFAGGLLED